MTPDTYEVRRAARLLNDITLAERIADFLVEEGCVSTIADVDETPIADEIRVGLFGDDYNVWVAEELNQTIGELTRPRGLVYDMLDNGHGSLTLCTTQVRRKVKKDDGGSIIVRKMSRFVTEDPDVAAMYRIEPQMQRLERTMERTQAIIAEDVRRIPQLESRVRPMITRANATMQRALPEPEGDE